jgi:predicted enzyme related to lactoylglutathione lyase
LGERTKHEPGTISWVDLATTDTDGAKQFYGGLLGWEFEDNPVPGGGVYTMCKVGGRSVAALNELRAEEREQGIPPHWNNYVTVADVDASAAKAAELGGTLVAPPFDVMTAGRMAVVQDPVGAFIALWEPRENIGAELVNEPGALTWNELTTSEPENAIEFYGALFGWTFEKVDTDEVDYWTIKNGDRSNGGIMRAMMPGLPSAWLPYFAVEDVAAAKETAESSGATTAAGPITAGAGTFAVFSDPQGAFVGFLAGELDD